LVGGEEGLNKVWKDHTLDMTSGEYVVSEDLMPVFKELMKKTFGDKTFIQLFIFAITYKRKSKEILSGQLTDQQKLL